MSLSVTLQTLKGMVGRKGRKLVERIRGEVRREEGHLET